MILAVIVGCCLGYRINAKRKNARKQEIDDLLCWITDYPQRFFQFISAIKKPVRILQLIAIILGSSMLIPVSCTVGVIGGTKVLMKLDARDVQKGDTVHSLFSVVAVQQGENPTDELLVLSLKEIGKIKKSGKPLNFLMPKTTFSWETEYKNFTYTVLEEKNKEQTIEVVEDYKDGDNTIYSKYRATKEEVYPLASHMVYFGYMFGAIPYAIAFSLALFAFGQIVYRLIGVKDE